MQNKIIRESNVCCPHVHKRNSFFPGIFLLNHVIDVIRQQQELKMHVSMILFIFPYLKNTSSKQELYHADNL